MVSGALLAINLSSYNEEIEKHVLDLSRALQCKENI
jgi:hypothetical protein